MNSVQKIHETRYKVWFKSHVYYISLCLCATFGDNDIISLFYVEQFYKQMHIKRTRDNYQEEAFSDSLY